MNNRQLKQKIDKWFIFDDLTKEYWSRKSAKNKKEAWEKTFTKWYLIAANFDTIKYDNFDNCGLCNMYIQPQPISEKNCNLCPISKETKTQSCYNTPLTKIDKRSGKKDYKVDRAINILYEISFLCKIYKKDMLLESEKK